MKITIQTIPHTEQKYSTVGNWIFDDKGDLNVFVSDMKNWRYEYYVGSHEVREALLCLQRGITEKVVTNFDMEFEKIRALCPKIIGNMEPGDMTSAPYNKEHAYATKIERMDVEEFGDNWERYDKTVNEL